VSAGETRAWLALSLNLAVLPGLGTLILRRWATGLLQLALAAGGAAGSIAWLLSFLREWARLGHFPLDRGPLFPIGLVGTMGFLLAWAWAGRSAWQEVREARARGR
jgi:hypothetical protein